MDYTHAAKFRNGRAPLRTTNRAARSVARLAKEGELSLMQELAVSARVAACLEECTGTMILARHLLRR
jgi:hypothetical protein